MRIAVAGSSGLIGRPLVARLEGEGHQVSRLVRRRSGPGEIEWHPTDGRLDVVRLEGCDAVVNLAGEPVGAKRWTAAQKLRIRDSRVQGTRLLAAGLAGLDRPPAVLVNASGTGYYGDRGDEMLTETAGPGSGFLAGVVADWEAATAPASEAGVRVVNMRSGVVQTPSGGALGKQLPLFRLGLGGRLAGGAQWTSWISIVDEVEAIVHAIGRDSLHGPVNFTAPEPVTNATYTKVLGRVLRRPAVLPVPRIALRIVLGEMIEDILVSQRAVPAKLLASGYRFRHPELEGALRAVLGAP